ncbi:MAG: tetratricopeptide repeat protein, partial [Planctomycetota bacterium]
MREDSPRLWLLILMVGAGLATAGLSESAAQRPFSTSRRQQIYAPAARPDTGKASFGDSISSSIKEGLGKLSDAVAPKPRVKPADDPISLATKAKPGVELHVAVARLYAESGKPAEAVRHYQKALEQTPDNLAALLGCAHLQDRLGRPAEARELYLRAARAHPNEAAVHNNLAMFCAGRGMVNESGAAFTRAIQLQPQNPKYRNNFARLLVRIGRTREAFAQLRAAH